MSLLLSTQEISKAYGSRQLFENISMGIFAGERVGLIGPNGAGKSTLLKILAGFEKPDSGNCSVKRSARVLYVAQESKFTADMGIDKYLEMSLRGRFTDDEELHLKVAIALSMGGFAKKDHPVTQLSGGWKKRLALVEALVQEPDLILLDEPTNHLDIEGILWLESVLAQNLDMGCIFISHDRYFLEHVATRVVELNSKYPQGMLSSEGSYSQFLQKKEEVLQNAKAEEQVLANKVRRELEWLRRGAKARQTKQKARAKEAHEMMDDLEVRRTRSIERRAEFDLVHSERGTQKLVQFKGVSKSMGGRSVIKSLDAILKPGSVLGLIGENGSGKTTVLKLFAGELAPDAGLIEFAEHLQVVYFDQTREKLDFEKTLKESLAPDGDSVVFRDRSIHVAAYARKFLFQTEQMNLRVKYLSGGEQARLLIAKMMLRPADLLLLDEPTNDLDIESLEVLEETLQEFGGAIVLVTHDRFFLEQVSDKLLALGDGAGVYFADYSQWLENKIEVEKARARAVRSAELGPMFVDAKTAPEEPGVARRKLSYNEKREFEQMEEKILLAEEALNKWKTQVEDPKIQVDAIRLKEAFEEMSRAQKMVDEMYARWAELEKIKK